MGTHVYIEVGIVAKLPRKVIISWERWLVSLEKK